MYEVSLKHFFYFFGLKPKAEVVKKELTPRDLSMGFDITMTKHKGQVSILKELVIGGWKRSLYASCIVGFNPFSILKLLYTRQVLRFRVSYLSHLLYVRIQLPFRFMLQYALQV